MNNDKYNEALNLFDEFVKKNKKAENILVEILKEDQNDQETKVLLQLVKCCSSALYEERITLEALLRLSNNSKFKQIISNILFGNCD